MSSHTPLLSPQQHATRLGCSHKTRCARNPGCSTITQIHPAARGKPRTVNNIAVAALITTAAAGKNLVDHASATAAIAEVTATD